MKEEPQDDGQVVHSWPKNSREEVRGTLREFKGLKLADVRVYAADDKDVDRPTRKGIAVQTRDLLKLRATVDALIEAAGVSERDEEAA